MASIGGTGERPGDSAWGGETIAVLGVIVALLPLGVLHWGGAAEVDPQHETISDYAWVPGGLALLTVSAFALAAVGAVLAGGLRRAGLPRPGVPAGLLVSASAALVLVALFPTHEPGTSAGFVSAVHRAAGGWVFAAVPLAAWLVARRARTASGWRAAAPALAWSAGVTGVLSAVFLLSHVPIVIGGSSVLPLMGGVQRVLYASVMFVLMATARATRLAIEHTLSPADVTVGTQLRGAA
ncbi:DUF998 domain-containing protein [Pseudonocardia nigra]|uniref:DUF998 domain-containing protein n=1 Tax=Pseudonocardia nigra TaxID=1921578 RepID=UPI001C5EC487|nr:DUF998 domain-containing protein [Pseudonocardia nigra]